MEQAHRPARRPHGFSWSANRHPEREQATLRVGMGAAVLLAYGLYAWLFPSHSAAFVTRLIAVYVSYGTLTLLIVNRTPPSRVRLAITTMLDQALLGTALGVGSATALPLLWAVFWFLIGSGCRYGKRPLALSLCHDAWRRGHAGRVATVVDRQSSGRARTGVERAGRIAVYLIVLVDRLGNANRDLARQASTDPLTGLSNRYTLEQIVNQSMTTAHDGSALLLIDLDGFKEVNDTYATPSATCCCKPSRKADSVARLGGNEFVVLARDVRNHSDVLSVADGIHSMLATITPCRSGQ